MVSRQVPGIRAAQEQDYYYLFYSRQFTRFNIQLTTKPASLDFPNLCLGKITTL
jgi:hypothetical protein